MSATHPPHEQQGYPGSGSQPLQPGSGQVLDTPSLRLEVWGITDKGQERQGNEDYVYPHSGADTFPWQPRADQVAQNGHLLLVADGVGGAQGGREASSSAAKIVVERYYELASPDPGDNLRVAIEEANASLYQQIASRPSLQEAGTTITAAVVKGGVLHVANVGDSRTYLIRNGQITLLTRDHTLTQQKLARGLIRLEQVETDEDRNVLTRSLGAGPTVQVDVFPALQLAAGDVILLCSDGLTDMLDAQEIARIAGSGSPKRAAKELVKKANNRGGFVNISVVIARVGGPGGAVGGGLLSSIREMSGRQKAILLAGALLVGIALCAMGYLGWTMYGQSRNEPTATPAAAAATEVAPAATAVPLTEPTQPQPTSSEPQPTDTVGPGQPTSTPAPTATPTTTPLPDRDDDGVIDSLDDCADVPGPREFGGCPDTDGDDIRDIDDQCPRESGLPRFNGCPDTDGDGIPDNQDNCPLQEGPLDNDGCPVEDVGGDGEDDDGGETQPTEPPEPTESPPTLTPRPED